MKAVPLSIRRTPWTLFLIAAILVCAGTAFSATYYVAKNGSNSNSGTQTEPWLTIQKAADSVSAGDTVYVGAGTYAERVVTKEHGAENNYITFQVWNAGSVKAYGFELNNRYNKITGFQFTGYKDNNSNFVYVDTDADYCIIENNYFGPGVGSFLEDVSTNASTRTLSSPNASFISDGFAIGDEFLLEFHQNQGYNEYDNSRAHVTAVTETSLTVDSAVPNAGPITVMFAVQVRCINFGQSGDHPEGGAANCIIRNNTFNDTWSKQLHICGRNHLIENNELSHSNYYDVMNVFGSGHIIRNNYIHDVEGSFPDKHTDVVQMFGPKDSYECLFEGNFIYNVDAQFFMVTTINADIRDWTIRNNVIANQEGHDAPSSNIYGAGFKILNNTFYRGSPRLGHPFYVRSDSLKGTAHNMVIKNNIFAQCGAGDHTSPDNYGWYTVASGVNNFLGDYNYAGGAPPTYPYKPNFDEDHGINGGDPMFLNVTKPLGNDGIPFTADDGLRLRDGSPLLGEGEGGVDIGAYPRSETPVPDPPENLEIKQ